MRDFGRQGPAGDFFGGNVPENLANPWEMWYISQVRGSEDAVLPSLLSAGPVMNALGPAPERRHAAGPGLPVLKGPLSGQA